MHVCSVEHCYAYPTKLNSNDLGASGVVPDLFDTLRSSDYVDMDSTETPSDTLRLLHDLADASSKHPPVPPHPADSSFDNADAASDAEEELGDEVDPPAGIRISKGGPGLWADKYDPETWCREAPHLYPWGLGMPGSVPGVSLQHDFQRNMMLVDNRFRRDKFYLFNVFATQQKRDVSQSARLAVERSSWNRVRAGMQHIKPGDIAAALEEEKNNQPVSNPILKEFFRATQSVRSHCVGSDSGRHAYRQEIWGISTICGNPFLFLTINPADQHDPIAMVLVGEDIDLDDFIPSMGPNATERSRLLAADPYASAEYFNLVIALVLEFLIGVTVTQRHVSSRPGVLGLIRAYFGMVEAQCRSNLHGHFLLWLANTPDCLEMIQKYKDPNFLAQLNEYVRRTIHADVPGLSEERGLAPAPSPHPSWARPPDPANPDFEALALQAERNHVESSQFHKCIVGVCAIKDKDGKIVKCKRGFPFPLSEEPCVQASGEWTVCGFYPMHQQYSYAT